MAKVVGAGLRAVATLFYMLDLLISAAILGIYSYYIATLHRHNQPIDTKWRAVEGLAGSATLYSIFAVLLTCFLGGMSFFAFLGMSFDIIFCGAMIAIAVLVRQGAHTCNNNNYITSPLGSGTLSGNTTTGLSLEIACKLDLAVLVLACAGALFFLLSFLLQLLVNRHHANEKYKGPNNRDLETEGNEKRGLFGRRAKTTREAYETGPDMAVVEPATGTTMGRQNDAYQNNNKYESTESNKYDSYPAVPAVQAPAVQAPIVQEPPVTTTGPNIVASSTVTRDAYYDPTARLPTTGAAGFVEPKSTYLPGQLNSSTNY